MLLLLGGEKDNNIVDMFYRKQWLCFTLNLWLYCKWLSDLHVLLQEITGMITGSEANLTLLDAIR